MSERVWTCKIGGEIPDELFEDHPKYVGLDFPMRKAVEKAFFDLFGVEAEFNFSGWGEELTEPERAVVENRLPDPEKV